MRHESIKTLKPYSSIVYVLNRLYLVSMVTSVLSFTLIFVKGIRVKIVMI